VLAALAGGVLLETCGALELAGALELLKLYVCRRHGNGKVRETVGSRPAKTRMDPVTTSSM
jgi:hypothetical protein